MAEGTLSVHADLRPYIENFKTLPGFTDKTAAAMAVKIEQRMHAASVKAARDAERAAKAVIGASREAAEKASEAFEAAHKASEATGGMFGGLTGPLTDMGDLLTKIGPMAAGASLAIAGIVAAELAVIASTVDVIANLDEYMGQLDEANIDILPAHVAALEDASLAYQSATASTLALRVEIAGELAPAVGRVSDAITGTTEIVRGWVQQLDAAHETVGMVTDGVLKLSSTGALGGLASVLGTVFGTVRDVGGALADYGESLRVGREETAASREEQAAALEVLGLGASMYDRTTTAVKKATAAVREHKSARQEVVEVIEIEAQVMDDFASFRAADAAAEMKLDMAKAKVRRQEQAERMADGQAQIDTEVRKAQAAQAAVDAVRSATVSAASSLVGSVSAAADVIVGLYDTTTESGRQAARKAFEWSKAFALADVAVKTAQAVMNAFTFPTPVGVALGVAAATIAAATQVAAITAQQPSFHAGLYGQGGLAADEIAATVRRGEVVVPAPTVMAAGGPEAVRDRVEGGGSGPTILYANMDGRRVMVPLTRAVGRRMEIGPRGHWAG
jgi:hypothetical protein